MTSRRPRVRRARLLVVVAALAASALTPFAGGAAASEGVRSLGAAADPRPVLGFLDATSVLPRALGRPTTVRPYAYTALSLDPAAARTALAAAPSAVDVEDGRAVPVRLSLPAPDGNDVRVDVVEDSVLAPALAAKHPDIRTYAGTVVGDASRTVRLDLTPLGFHASVRAPGGQGAWYIDPAFRSSGSTAHLSYYGAAVPRDSAGFVERGYDDTARVLDQAPALRTKAGEIVNRRTYRLAFASDPSYATYWGTTDAKVLAAKTTLVNRVNQVYNDDLAIKFVLVDGTDKLNFQTKEEATAPNGPCGANACYPAASFYGDGTTGDDGMPDGPDGCDGALLDRNVFVLGQVLGADAFDLGHIGLGLPGGGIAGLGVVGTGDKAAGCTGTSKPTGDFYAVDYVAHEIGHQMGADHTFNGAAGSCEGNRNADTSVEPGSGSSVMAYAGICARDDLQPHSDPYFSQASIDEITATVDADPATANEVQTVSLAGFDADGDSFQLTYPGATAQTITRGALSYNTLTVTRAVSTLTGCTPTVASYDAGASQTPISAPTDKGFTLTFAGGCAGRNLDLLGIGTATGGVTGFVGNQVRGGDTSNQGSAIDPTTNHAPTVTAPADKTIPVQTPFTLTGKATDVDAGQTLTYLWEQDNAGGAGAPIGADGSAALLSNTKTDGPLFRVFSDNAVVTDAGALLSPSPGINLAGSSPSRTFPDLVQVAAGNTNAASGACPAPPTDAEAAVPDTTLDCYSEFLPTADYGDPLVFRLTARDGFPTGGGTQFDDVTLTLDPDAGPFLVTSRATAGTPARAKAKEKVTWDVAGTDAAALAPMVKITMSADGGLTYPYVLAASTANDGTEEITWPDVTTSKARVRIDAVDNYFFDLNDADFAITGGSTTPGDPGAPQTRITGGVGKGAFLLQPTATVRYAADQAGATFKCAFDGEPLECGAGGATQLTGLTEGTHRFTVAAVSADGVQDASPVTRAFSVVYDDDRLRASDGWRTMRDSAAYDGSLLVSTQRGLTLDRQVSKLVKGALLVSTGPRGGRVAVFLGQQKLRTVDLRSSRSQDQVLVSIGSLGSKRPSGVLRIVTLDDREVRIDGIGLYAHGQNG